MTWSESWDTFCTRRNKNGLQLENVTDNSFFWNQKCEKELFAFYFSTKSRRHHMRLKGFCLKTQKRRWQFMCSVVKLWNSVPWNYGDDKMWQRKQLYFFSFYSHWELLKNRQHFWLRNSLVSNFLKVKKGLWRGIIAQLTTAKETGLGWEDQYGVSCMCKNFQWTKAKYCCSVSLLEMMWKWRAHNQEWSSMSFSEAIYWSKPPYVLTFHSEILAEQKRVFSECFKIIWVW